MQATINERGNGFPEIGEYVRDGNEVYRVVSFSGPIHTASSGRPNYAYAEVEPADWDDCDEDSIRCDCEIERCGK